MSHTHNHHHDDHHHDEVFHVHGSADQMQQAFFITLAVLAVEVLGGLWSHSLALLSDAGHVLTDIGAIGLSWYALRQSLRQPTERMTFGFHRTGILAALANAVSLIVIAIWILFEASRRFMHPVPVHGAGMFVSAAVGLAANLYMAMGMRHSENLNVRSTVLHMLGDAGASAGVIVGGLIILGTRWYFVDPLLSLLIAVLIAGGAWRILKRTVSILMESTPSDISLSQIATVIRAVPGVIDVHDLHVWSLAAGRHALSCHVVLGGNPTLQETQAIVREIEHHLMHERIGHATIQPEDVHHLHDNSLLCCDARAVPHHH